MSRKRPTRHNYGVARMHWMMRVLLLLTLLLGGVLHSVSADAATAGTCGAATTRGSAPTDYQNYCWFNFSGYNDSTARNGGQTFTFTLPGGSTLSLKLSIATNGATPALVSAPVPSWSGAAFGNSAFLGIPGDPVLYEAQQGTTVTATLSNIVVTSPSGSTSGVTYEIVAGDGESTNDGESLTFTTNGTAWAQLAQVSNGSAYPAVTGVGSQTVKETGIAGTVGAYVFGSAGNPTQISATMVGSGLQGAVFAVRVASVTVTSVITNQRVNAADQFTYAIDTSSGTVIASGTTTGTSGGPFPVASASFSASFPFMVTESLASASVSTFANYTESLTCTNGSTSGSATKVPTNVSSTSYSFASLQYGDAIACVFTNTAYPSITGFVYNDVNHNSHIDPSEAGTGLSNLYVKLATSSNGSCQFPATLAVAVNPTTGAYDLPGLAPGSYCTILDTNNTLSDVTPGDPTGWIGTEAASGLRQVTLNTATATAQNFGLFNGSTLTGVVFADTGAGSGTANNGVQDGTETGIASATVNAVASGNTVATSVTNGAGAYTLWIPATVTASTVITPVPPNGYLATNGSAGTSGGTYTRPSVTFTPSSSMLATGVNFGLVPPNTLAPDGEQNTAPDTVVFYPHTFVANSAGQVTFTTSATAAPSITGWTETIYRDVNCNGQLDSGDTQITTAVSVAAGQTVCVLVKEFVPATAPVNAQNKVTISAAFVYANASPALSATLTRTDTTTVTAPGAVQLNKTVTNMTQGGSAGTSDNASPGDTLQYQLLVSNPGSTPITQLVVNDNTPAFTAFVSAACPTSANLPGGITACTVSSKPSVAGQGALAWSFTGSLAPGAKVIVTFQVTVSP